MNIYEERDYLLDVIKQLQRDSRHLEDGLIDARRVIWDYRKIEKNATSTLAELVESLDSMEKERDEIVRWRNAYGDALDQLQISRSKRDAARRWSAAWKRAAKRWKRYYRAAHSATAHVSAQSQQIEDNYRQQRDDFKVRLEGSRNMVDHVVAERNQARRWAAAWKRAAKDNRLWRWRNLSSVIVTRDKLGKLDKRIAELEKERDEDNASLHNLIKSSEKLITGIRLRDKRIAELEGLKSAEREQEKHPPPDQITREWDTPEEDEAWKDL